MAKPNDAFEKRQKEIAKKKAGEAPSQDIQPTLGRTDKAVVAGGK